VIESLYRKREEGVEVEEIEEEFTNFSKALYEKRDKTNDKDLGDGLLALMEYVRSSKRQQRLLQQPLFMVMNDIYDCYKNGMEGTLSIQF
jgi:hypothetical protein